jgi:hypothetical protein
MTQNDGQSFNGRKSVNTPQPRQNDGVARSDISPSSKPEEEDTSDEDATDSGSGSDSEDETIISDEVQEVGLGQQLEANPKSDASVSEKLQVSRHDDEVSAKSVPSALLGEIRKMIQEECKSNIIHRRAKENLLTDTE